MLTSASSGNKSVQDKIGNANSTIDRSMSDRDMKWSSLSEEEDLERKKKEKEDEWKKFAAAAAVGAGVGVVGALALDEFADDDDEGDDGEEYSGDYDGTGYDGNYENTDNDNVPFGDNDNTNTMEMNNLVGELGGESYQQQDTATGDNDCCDCCSGSDDCCSCFSGCCGSDNDGESNWCC
jgi:hypothetical protein